MFSERAAASGVWPVWATSYRDWSSARLDSISRIGPSNGSRYRFGLAIARGFLRGRGVTGSEGVRTGHRVGLVDAHPGKLAEEFVEALGSIGRLLLDHLHDQ